MPEVKMLRVKVLMVKDCGENEYSRPPFEGRE